MKYFIGIPIPNTYKTKIEMLRAKYKFFTTEPHITLVPPPALGDDDHFIKDVIEVCKQTKPFNIKLETFSQFGNRVLFISVNSPELINLYNEIYCKLNLEKEKRGFTPHLTIVKQRIGRKIDIEKIKKSAEISLIPYHEFMLKSLVIYHQPKVKSIYVPYMEIPFNLN
ncbi:MAG: 2'-5' RNA ligase family protein [Tissierellia bacterium]|nr:2'-5' RNA ligase family protein [Tissierellia bacterium]MDD4781231.1 2'-5' RNA ligase family protein [Tissierellia bacterium]